MESARETQLAEQSEAAAPPSAERGSLAGPQAVLRLQRQIGNRAVGQLLRNPKTPVRAIARSPTAQAEDAKTVVDQRLRPGTRTLAGASRRRVSRARTRR